MKDFLASPYAAEMIRTISDMYAKGWDERNGGNVSMLLTEDELAEYADVSCPVRSFPLGFSVPGMDGRMLLVTGTGKYFRNIKLAPESDLGIVRIADGGRTAELLWGFKDGGKPTSELAAHLMCHEARLAADPAHRVLTHCHPANVIAMTFVHELNEREFTRSLWCAMTESIMVFPEGVGLLPWMPCGTVEIAEASAEKMKDRKLVVWAHHGIYGSGSTLAEAFGLIETVDKSAEIYLKIAPLKILSTMSDAQLRANAQIAGVKPREGYLDL